MGESDALMLLSTALRSLETIRLQLNASAEISAEWAAVALIMLAMKWEASGARSPAAAGLQSAMQGTWNLALLKANGVQPKSPEYRRHEAAVLHWIGQAARPHQPAGSQAGKQQAVQAGLPGS